MAETALEMKAVNRTYADDKETVVEALRDISLNVERGEFVSLIGSSGCGKTTLLRLIAGLDEPQSGQLLLDGREIRGTDPKRGYVIQQGGLFPWLTVSGNIAYGLKVQGLYKERKADVAKYIDLIGLNGFEKSFPHQISGGMAQRVAIARALINEPELLLLDEPLGALDAFTRMDLQDKILELWQSRGVTIVLVTHDVDEAIYLSDRVVVMTPRPGKIVEVVPVDLPRPRDRGNPDFFRLRTHILERLHLVSSGTQPEYSI